MKRSWSSAAVALSVALVGCGSTEGQGPIDAAQEAVAGWVLPVEDENRLGQQMKAQLAQELTLLDDPQVVGYVRQLGQQIVQAAGDDVPEGIQFDFNVVDDDRTLNAFAIPGGSIYVYTGLLEAMKDEAELMGVLGHEVAHVTRRHIAQQLAAQYGAETLTSLLGSAGGVTGLVGQLAGSVASQGYLLKYSRDQEREADHVGMAYEKEAGWDPSGMVGFFQTLQERTGETSSMAALLQTHPTSEERIENARERLEELQPVPQRRNPERYQQMLTRLGGPSAPAK